MHEAIAFIRDLPTEFKLTCILGILNGIDFITGTAAAFKLGVWDSHKSKWGFVEKLGILGAIVVCYLLDSFFTIMPAEVDFPFQVTTTLGVIATTCFTLSESGSILENLVKLGVHVPAPVRKALAICEEKFGDKIGTADKIPDSTDDNAD